MELTKWEVDQMGIDEIGIDKVGINLSDLQAAALLDLLRACANVPPNYNVPEESLNTTICKLRTN